MGRGRPRKFKLTFHNPHPQRSAVSATVWYRNTCFSSVEGEIRISTSFPAAKPASFDEQVEPPDLPDWPLDEHSLDEHSMDEHSLDEHDALRDPAYLAHLDQISTEQSRRKRTAGDEPMRIWLTHRERYLEELITLEGRGHRGTSDDTDFCPTCPETDAKPGTFECLDCFGRQLQCQDCMLLAHSASPFHRIRRWNGTFFKKTSLKALGLRLQLGHKQGTQCTNPQRSPGDDFTVVDMRAIHSVCIDFCGCGQSSQLHMIQLLRHRLYPATTINPQTAITFKTLEAFELLSYTSKVSAFEYYQALARQTDNTGTAPPKDRYPGFLLVVRQWRYLKMMKRAARGHDPAGPVAATREGECAVLCPACPHPGKNLPEGWEDAPLDKRWLYGLFLGIDANFRLKRKDVSSDTADPDLGQGFAYFVEEKAYKGYLAKHYDEKEPKSTCSRHDTVNLSNAKLGQGHAATGVGTIECARHNMKRPQAVGDLQFGERYCNMDYLFWKSLAGSTLLAVLISYDIVCQWSINLQKRMLELDHEFFLFNGKVYVKFLVPKFHLPAHIARCRTRFSFNFTPGMGRTDGEAPERGWAEINPLATSTKEMGPGSRRDTLDAHFGDYNWRKVMGMGLTLLRKIKAAASDMADHTIAHDQLNSSLPPSTIEEWTAEIKAWEKDPSQLNPYDLKVAFPTQAAVCRTLAESEALDVANGHDIALDVTVTPSVLISTGLDMEAEQRSVKAESSKDWLHAQDRQKTRLLLQNNALTRKIVLWSQRQQLYIPAVVVLRRMDAQAQQNKQTARPIYDYPLYLPSEIQSKVPCDQRLMEIEWELRLAQAEEALEGLRRNLQVRSYLLNFKTRFVRGQHANTRARNAIATVEARIKTCAEEYRAAHKALLALGTLLEKVGWQQQLLPLAEADIREVSEGEEGSSEGSRQISWIWRTVGMAGVDENDPMYRDALRVEWCKSRARAMRYTEEVSLLLEEMERVLRFMTWQEAWWIEKADYWYNSEIGRTPRGEGLRAYAERQAALRQSISIHFKALWQPVASFVKEARERIVTAAAAAAEALAIETAAPASLASEATVSVSSA